jgi:glyoxylase-like metal-dependent hydrolase (beta-lactamase superfamily II)
MQTQSRFVATTPVTGTRSAEATALAGEPMYKADLTTAQMLAAGKVAKLTIEPLRRDVSLISGSGGNVLVLEGPDGKLIVDSGLSTSKVQMSGALESISLDPLRFLINTHWHFDHTGGNAWMHEAGATIFAHEETRTRMNREQSIPEFDGVYPPSASAALPTVTFDHLKRLSVNGHDIILKRYTPAHTETDISVFLPDADVLHVGDSCFSGVYPFIDYGSGGNIDGMIAACRETLALIGPSTTVVSGHGPAGTRNDIKSFEQMLVEVRGIVAMLKQSGASEKEVVARKPTASFDSNWSSGFVSPALFTWLVYRGV